MALPKDLRQEVMRSMPLETVLTPEGAKSAKNIVWMLGKLDVSKQVQALIEEALARMTFYPHPDTDMTVVVKLTRAGKGKQGGNDDA